MVLAIEIEKNKANELIQELKKENLIDNSFKIQRSKDSVIIPIKENISKYTEKIIEIKNPITQNQKDKKLKDVLRSKLSKEIVDQINSAYDIVGDIIIIGIDQSLKQYYEVIGKTLLDIHPQVKTVLNKIGEHKGVYRTQDMELVFGIDKKETIIKENNCKIKIDVEKVFCSTRLSAERKRICSLVKENEIIGVYFAGAGPFALAISKSCNVKEIVAIELNDLAVKYLIENIKINKVNNIKPILGDVVIKAKDYPNYFDRIIMPLPKSSDLFLESAISSVKDNGFIHIYKFVSKDDPYTDVTKTIKEIANKNQVVLEIVNKRIIRSYSPSIVQIVLDLKIKKN